MQKIPDLLRHFFSPLTLYVSLFLVSEDVYDLSGTIRIWDTMCIVLFLDIRKNSEKLRLRPHDTTKNVTSDIQGMLCMTLWPSIVFSRS